MNRTPYEFISLYEFAALFTLLSVSVCTLNVFAAVLASLLILKQIPERMFKSIESKCNIRPKSAFDCNMINKGGDASKNPGFPSGHTTVASMLFTIFLLEYLNRRNSTVVMKVPPIVIVTLVFAILVPMARVRLTCHTADQVMGGFILGFIIGVLFEVAIDPLLLRIPRYSQDKEKFVSCVFDKN